MSTIQVSITGDEEYGRYIKALICGDPGSGKTLISSTFPNVLYASAEGGLMSIARRKLPFIKVTASEQLLAIKNAMDQDPEVRAKLLGLDQRGVTRVDTIVIDTIDEIARVLIKERLEANKRDTFQIADWGWLGDQLRSIVRAFRNLDMHVVFTCHLKQSEDGESGRQYFKPALQGAMGDEIAGYVDLALLLRAENVTRVVDGESRRVMQRHLVTVPDPSYPWIKDRSGALPAELSVNFVDDYDRMNDLIFGGLDEAVAASTKIVQELTEEVAIPDVPLKVEVADEQLIPEDAEPIVTTPEPDPVRPSTPVEDVRAMSVTEKMQIDAPYPCEMCETAFTSGDQRDLSCIKKRRVLCTTCYKAES